MKRSVFKRFGGFDESLSSVMDVDYWLRIYKKTCYRFFDQTISNFMIRRGAQSSGLARKRKNEDNTFKVRKRYLNSVEMAIFKTVRSFINRYNKTYR
jgi:hypothetical protein